MAGIFARKIFWKIILIYTHFPGIVNMHLCTKNHEKLMMKSQITNNSQWIKVARFCAKSEWWGRPDMWDERDGNKMLLEKIQKTLFSGLFRPKQGQRFSFTLVCENPCYILGITIMTIYVCKKNKEIKGEKSQENLQKQ